ncbi:LpxL/LpxP family acyltransferase [Verminephrobacter aporrectodeae]|uniref:Lipid A biosynthesis acyltransferase n=1 Tax=Verminephrobacter aporrectodeae subsp. tuberculatae TaxID=1110392 RepID=A0ABT3KYG7_9BURK|nr:lipid A biosynthesis acyltransferase [Verminephrobacter aporrectodeae]MCW5223576.1 lipid A biosynthesis acyltransferase [Verminephrobacter aporrectodeae subsp. tuberculatae]MCW5256262.1 lipid A biosynthesis acyltransferase [Verminephrobacter aporrectodeae subsp. tuberculatae]MCW5289041.1 lipid A biosynthesis acyltransferase [Verminephrobacter aporrectodeae subsp. tuberculatae]MCW5323378.1 lipid A biosynthesis acyltransferase [Verminephrobacter aporrectodeae subsp. tuberculatae]MCW8164405.1 
MTGRLGVWFMRVLARLPLPVLRGMGWFIGRVLYALAVPRRRVALRNLALCYPQASARQRRQWARETFVLFCQSWLDRSWLWLAPADVVLRRVQLQGALEELQGDAPCIIFAPHFYGMDAGGSALTLHTSRAFTSIFSTHPSPAVDAWLRAGRQRFGNVRMLNRSGSVKPIIENLRRGGLLYLLPDMDFGRNDSLFVPFYGVAAATLPSLPRFARLGRAKVIAMVTRLTRAGYCAEITPAWPDYPSADAEADTAQMNARLQTYIDAAPGQYYWVHKRFKTRPEGEPPVYS